MPMYLVGEDHPNRTAAAAVVARLITQGGRLLTDAEVFQEILHRYVAIRRRDAIQPAFDTLRGLVDEVIPIDIQIAESAKDLVLAYPELSARDAVHAAAMQQHGIAHLLSFDAGFDLLPDIERIYS